MRYAQVQRQRVHGSETLFALHIAGCQDLAREVRDHEAYVDEFEADTLADAKATVIDGQLEDQGYSRERDLTVYPCCTGRAPKAPKPLDPSVCPGTGMAFTDDRTPRHLYRACPVCGKLVGAKRGVAPRHKAS